MSSDSSSDSEGLAIEDMKPSARFGAPEVDTPEKIEVQIEEEKFQTEKQPRLEEITLDNTF